MMQQDTADDYVLATNETHTVREFVEKAFIAVGTTVAWKGTFGSVEEKGVDAADETRVLVAIDPAYFRPTVSSGWCAGGRTGLTYSRGLISYICMPIR